MEKVIRRFLVSLYIIGLISARFFAQPASAAVSYPVHMPSAWVPYVQPVLDRLSDGNVRWQVVSEGDSPNGVRLRHAQTDKPGMCRFPLASVAAVVRDTSGYMTAVSLEKMLEIRPRPELLISEELRAFSPVPLPEATILPHSEVLARAVKRERVVGLVRWQTGDTPWPAGMRPLRIGGAYPDRNPDLIWYGDIDANAETPELNALCEALRRWGTSPVEIVAGGDIMLDRGIKNVVEQTGNINFPFEKIADMFADADLRVANLECLITDLGEPLNKGWRFRVGPWGVESLKNAGFEVLSLGNNHAYDYGPDALLDTIDRLNRAGIKTVGAGKDEAAARAPIFVERNGLRIAFLAYMNTPSEVYDFYPIDTRATQTNPGVAWAFHEHIAEDIRTAKTQADIVIILLHSGVEGSNTPNQIQKDAARIAIDAGADAVIGAHPHIMQGIEFYNGRFIAYSLGNLVFDMRAINQALMRLWIGPDGVRAYAWEPFKIAYAGQPIKVHPGEDRLIIEEIDRLTAILNPGR